MSTYTKPIPTRRQHRIDRKRRGDVPMPQLYREIAEGYQYFLAKRMKAETLGISLREVGRPKLKSKSANRTA